MDYKAELIKLLQPIINEPFVLETPPSPVMGDFALPCFKLKKKAHELQPLIKVPKFIKKIEQKGPYLNFFVDETVVGKEIMSEILKKKEKYGSLSIGKGKTLLVEFSSPNIGKPFGIGHLRSTIIGNALANIAEKAGYKVIRMNYVGDWGTQFGKLIVGFKRFGNTAALKKNAIDHLLEVYVKVNAQPELEEEGRLWFKKLEEGNKEAIALWKEFKERSLAEFKGVYSLLGVDFDVWNGESGYTKAMEEIEKVLEKKRLIEESDGAQIIKLEEEGLGVCIVKKTNGTSTYITRDIAAAIDRKKKYKFDAMWYEVGIEQTLHFKQLFAILKKIGHDWAENCVHIEHGLYLDKDGKKFATRKGKTVLVKAILQEMIDLAKKSIEEKNPKLKEKENVARQVAVAALLFGDLKNNRINDSVFDLERFLEFEGDTGPYVQYTYARASSILRKAGKVQGKMYGDLVEAEGKLVKVLGQYPMIMQIAVQDRAPHHLAQYALHLAQTFNAFYRDCPVLDQEMNVTQKRIALVQATRLVLQNALALLGIEVPEEM